MNCATRVVTLLTFKSSCQELLQSFPKPGWLLCMSTKLPIHESLDQLAQEFNDFFINKIRDIRTDVMESSIYQPECDRENRSLDTVVRQEVMTSLSYKTCFLDPILTLVVNDNIDSVLPVLSEIVRRSLTPGIFPTILKESHVHPRLKNIKLEGDSFSSYRPVANISFLSKVTEKFASVQVHNYLRQHGLFPSLQSAYRQHHCTETELLKVTDAILKTLDSHNEVVLVMLVLSAAFDTLDHTLLDERLRSYFGFSGTALQWFSSYLHGLSQRVIIGDAISSPTYLEFGVPQGSILGPLLFTLYIAPLQDVIQAYNLNCMFYADDS